jgi:hypothetical protein
MLSANFMFQNLTAVQKEKVYRSVSVKLRTTVASEGVVGVTSGLVMPPRLLGFYFVTGVIGCYCATHRAMTLRHVSVDEVIIREGERGDEMYIIERYGMQLAHLYAW